MTSTEQPLLQRRGRTRPHPLNISQRGRHSNLRASQHRKYREKFDQFRSSAGQPNGSYSEYEGWNLNTELSSLDRSIISAENQALNERIHRSVVPRIGHLASIRPDGIWRFAYCQLNNISGRETRLRKIKAMERIARDFDIDGITMCELGVNWQAGKGHSLKSWCSPHFPQEIRCTTANNTHSPRTSLSQPGGTGILLTQSLLEYAKTTENDHRHLGRWTSWVLSHTPDHVTRLIVAYCPCKVHGRTAQGLKTVHRQHITYIQQNGLEYTPYQLFVKDLVSQLKTWRANNERLILCIDLNEHPLTGVISKRIRSDDIELFEQTSTFWPDGKEPNTHIEGSKPIDGIFTTPDVDLTSCLLLSFHESVGDHRTTIFEITTQSAIGRHQGKIVRPSSRRLTLRQPTAITSYNACIHDQFSTHRIPQRLATLLEESNHYSFPPPLIFRDKCETIHQQIAEIRLLAESQCRKLYTPSLEFSPTIQYWYDRAHAYQQLIKIKEGKAKKYTDISRAIKFAAKKNIPNPRTLTLQQCIIGLAACKLHQKDLRKSSSSLRRQFQLSSSSNALAAGDTDRGSAIRERMRREQSISTWRRINKVTRKSNGRACREVQQNISGTTYSYTTKAEVEEKIQVECQSRFQLGHSAPIASTLLGVELQYLHNIEIAYEILSGTYTIPPTIDAATRLILDEIATLGKAVLSGSCPRQITITGSDYITYWNRINDKTSSSPSGLHITHYKASARDPELAELFAMEMNLIIHSGIHPLRWGTALQVMLEKIAGICLVDKLRSIQLYEADLNWFLKFVFNDIALSQLEEAGQLPEEHYSKKGSTSEDACFEKTLTFDISRQSRLPMASISVDAAQCYDRVHPTLMSLIWLALTNHPHSVIIILHVLQQMKIFTRTGFGDSTTHFGGTSDSPLCGLGQGSKAAPASWLQLSSMIINAYKQEGLASVITDPITGLQTESVGCIFVDDTDLYSMNACLWSAMLVALQAQACVSMWSALLRATGGAIKGSKSFWYLVDYKCVHGTWEYCNIEEHDAILVLEEAPGVAVELERKPHDAAAKTLGVLHSPAGDHSAHLMAIRDKSFTWLNSIKNGHLPTSLVWMSYYQQLWPGLRYALGSLSNSLPAAEHCLDKFDFQLLPHIGVNRNIKKEWRLLHTTFGGIGLLSLPVEQFICRTSALLQHFNTDTIIGRKLTCSIHLLQLQLGTNGNPFLLSFTRHGHLAPNSWASRYWETLHHYPITLHMQYPTIPFPRVHDETIMDFLDKFMLTPTILTSINRCRCALNSLFLSDISTADGKSIDPDVVSNNNARRNSRYSFPPEQPTKEDWQRWSDIWYQALGRYLLLPHPLGRWIHESHIRWRWYYDGTSDTISEDTGSTINTFTRPGRTGSRTRSGGYYTLTNTTASAALGKPASCVLIPHNTGSKHRIALRNTGPAATLPTKLPASFWDILANFGGDWMWEHIHLDTDSSVEWFLKALISGSLLWVTDGSYNPSCSPDICAAGWFVHDKMTNKRWSCSFYELSDLANSYRAELLGLYSIHVFILALATYFDRLESSTVNVRCDNKGALRASSRKFKRIRPTSKCADILRAFRQLRENLSGIHIHYAHVPAHMDDLLAWDDLTLDQQLNVQCDSLAKRALAKANTTISDASAHPDTRLLPLEQTAVFIKDHKLHSDIASPIRFNCSEVRARTFLCSHRGWTHQQFDEVHWSSLDLALSGKTVGFRTWLAKQHSNFCATRVQMYRSKQADDNNCPSCLTAAEDADHLCRCPNHERTQLLRDCTAELESWMQANNNTHHELCYWIPHYILCRGQILFADMGPMSPTMMDAARSQDLIGWRNFMEGRVSSKIYAMQRYHLVTTNSRLSPKRWMSTFITKVLHTTHSQWIFRNFMLHDRAAGYLRLKECTEATIQIDALLQTHPSSLPTDSQFLLEFDTDKLLSADTDTQQYWLSAMHAALAAKSTHPPLPSPHLHLHRHRYSRPKASPSISQIRREINTQLIPPSWVTSPSAITGNTTTVSRPTPHAIQQSLPSNKRRKPD